MNDTVISAKNLSLTFQTNDGPVHALKDVDLEINKGLGAFGSVKFEVRQAFFEDFVDFFAGIF